MRLQLALVIGVAILALLGISCTTSKPEHRGATQRYHSYEKKNRPDTEDASPYWAGYAPLRPGQDLYYAHNVAGSFNPENRSAIEEFLKSKNYEYFINRPSIGPENSMAGYKHNVAMIRDPGNAFEIQGVVVAMRSSHLFARVAPVLDVESGNGIGWADIASANKLFSNPANPSASEANAKLTAFLKRFVKDLGPNPTVELISSGGFAYKFDLNGLKNAVLKGRNDWETVTLDLHVSKPLDGDGLVIHIYFETSTAPGSSRAPMPSKFEEVTGEDRNMVRFATKIANAMKQDL